MKNIEFYIFRHGQTDWNRLKKVQGNTDIPLNDLGRKEAQSLREFFSSINIDRVFTSDLLRAHETAEIVFENRSVSIQKSPELREANFGEVEGMHIDELLSRFSTKFWDIHKGGPEADTFSYPGGETRGEVRERLISFIDKIRVESSTSSVALSTHGGALRSIMHHYLPNEAELVKIPNCVVYKISFNGDDFQVEGPFNNEKDLCYN
ncbi:histidine phosphatase family protein [Halobacteriovorax sp.]|uniref:histidine phosphatase family protein n=1 Tax=Halobacteriovorax sp. TaxID=2020862 RepID=UPI003569D297